MTPNQIQEAAREWRVARKSFQAIPGTKYLGVSPEEFDVTLAEFGAHLLSRYADPGPGKEPGLVNDLMEACGNLQHWHDTHYGGMIVSGDSVRAVWQARDALEKKLKSAPPSQVEGGEPSLIFTTIAKCIVNRFFATFVEELAAKDDQKAKLASAVATILFDHFNHRLASPSGPSPSSTGEPEPEPYQSWPGVARIWKDRIEIPHPCPASVRLPAQKLIISAEPGDKDFPWGITCEDSTMYDVGEGEIIGAPAKTGVNPNADNYWDPKVFIEVFGELSIDGRSAKISPVGLAGEETKLGQQQGQMPSAAATRQTWKDLEATLNPDFPTVSSACADELEKLVAYWEDRASAAELKVQTFHAELVEAHTERDQAIKDREAVKANLFELEEDIKTTERETILKCAKAICYNCAATDVTPANRGIAPSPREYSHIVNGEDGRTWFVICDAGPLWQLLESQTMEPKP